MQSKSYGKDDGLLLGVRNQLLVTQILVRLTFPYSLLDCPIDKSFLWVVYSSINALVHARLLRIF